MKISIITACYNSASTIRDTLKTIEMQTHKDIEHIVIDGGSTDGTLEILNEYRENIAYLVSEPDEGLYEAMNKGIKKATGDVIGLLHSNDLFANEHSLSYVVNALADLTIDACYGDLVYVQPENINKVARYWKSRSFTPDLIYKGFMPAHPTFYVRKEIHEKYSMLFDVSYKLAADYEVLLRLLGTHKIRTQYIPNVMVKMRLGGTTNKSIKNIINQNKEILRALKQHHYKYTPALIILNKLLNRTQQYLMRSMYAQ